MQKLLIFILILGSLTACASGQISTTTIEGVIASPSPHFEFTSIPSPSATINPIPPLVTEILPTPTPNLYIVETNDTLTGIASKFNITLEELVAANPSIGSQALTVGLALVIPPEQKPESEPTATPMPVSIQQTQCYQNQDGSLWCLALLKNEFAEPLQNISVVFSLIDSDEKVVSYQIAYSLLDILPYGKSFVIGALFPAPIPDGYHSQTQLLSASRLPSTDNRYPLIHLQNNLVQVDWGGLSARVSGQIVLDFQSNAVERVWILAVAYERSGNVIGFRRWGSNNPLSHPDVLNFDFELASLGPEIDHVDLLVEAAK